MYKVFLNVSYFRYMKIYKAIQSHLQSKIHEYKISILTQVCSTYYRLKTTKLPRIQGVPKLWIRLINSSG